MIFALSITAEADYTTTGTMTDLYRSVVANSGAAPEDGYYSISSATELEYLSAYTNGGYNTSGVTFYLTTNIHLGYWQDDDDDIVEAGEIYDSKSGGSAYESSNWTAIGYHTASDDYFYFDGTFDGCNYVVSGIYISTTDNYQGLFGYVSGGTIKNAGVIDSYIAGGGNVGGVAGRNAGMIMDSYNMGSVSGSSDSIGGVAGIDSGPGSDIEYCYYDTNMCSKGGINGSDKPGKAEGKSEMKVATPFTGWNTNIWSFSDGLYPQLNGITEIYAAIVDPTIKIFTAATAGYGKQTAQVFTIMNTGIGDLTGLSAQLTTGTNFEISTILSAASISSGGTATVSVRPKTELSVDTYTGTLTITGDNGISLPVELSFTVDKAIYGIILSESDTHTFTYGSVTPLFVWVANTGNAETGDLTVALSGDNADDFILSTESIDSIAKSGSDIVGVIPKDSLSVGTHTATVTVSGDYVTSQSFTVSFTLTDETKPTVTDVSPDGTGTAISGSIVVTFSEAMDTSAGTVSLDGGDTYLTGGTWSEGNTVYTVAYYGLTYDTQYTVAISGFRDAAPGGNVMNTDNTNTFTTKSRPVLSGDKGKNLTITDSAGNTITGILTETKNGAEAEIPRDEFDELAQAGAGSVTVDMDLATVILSGNAMDTISGAPDGTISP